MRIASSQSWHPLCTHRDLSASNPTYHRHFQRLVTNFITLRRRQKQNTSEEDDSLRQPFPPFKFSRTDAPDDEFLQFLLEDYVCRRKTTEGRRNLSTMWTTLRKRPHPILLNIPISHVVDRSDRDIYLQDFQIRCLCVSLPFTTRVSEPRRFVAPVAYSSR